MDVSYRASPLEMSQAEMAVAMIGEAGFWLYHGPQTFQTRLAHSCLLLILVAHFQHHRSSWLPPSPDLDCSELDDATLVVDSALEQNLG